MVVEIQTGQRCDKKKVIHLLVPPIFISEVTHFNSLLFFDQTNTCTYMGWGIFAYIQK